MKEFSEKFIDRVISDLCMDYDRICGANKNIARITPLYIDGLKPVGRRILYLMYYNSGKELEKVATIVGNTLKFHPHGDSSIYAVVVNLAQWWNNNVPLIHGSGSFGTPTGDEAGASRYISARISDFAYDCFFSDWKDSVVDMVPDGVSGKMLEPLYLPAKYPVVLLNGILGIGYGDSSNIPPYNFKDVVEATIKLMKDPNADILMIPDSPTGCDIVAGNFKKITETGSGIYTMRCKYEIDDKNNIIRITALPYQVVDVNSEGTGIRQKIASIKENGGLPELINMKDFSGKTIDLQLHIRNDVNPYKFIKKLIDEVSGLERSYPVNITVIDDYKSYDYSVRRLLIEWIKWRQEQKRVVVNHKRTTLLAEQRTNDVKLFLMNGDNLERTIALYKAAKNRTEIEKKLIEEFKDSEIRMDSLQAKALSDMRMYELTIEVYEKCIERKGELIAELKEIEDILNMEDGINKLIIAELHDGLKKFGTPRNSNVVPYKISIETEVTGECILQLSSDGNITRRTATNVDEEPVPVDINGFAVKVENDSSFVAIDETGHYSFISVKELPVDQEVPLGRFTKEKLGNIISLVPYDIDSPKCCLLISKLGVIKKFKISEMKPSKKPCIDISHEDTLVKGIISRDVTSHKDILVFTKNGYGQRLDPNDVRLISYTAKGINGFKLQGDDEIIGAYSIDGSNQYLLYITTRGKCRLNLSEYLPTRETKHDEMVKLITLVERDNLLSVIGCNRLDKLQVFYSDGTSEVVDISKVQEGTMGSLPEKVVNKNMVSTSIVKVKLI